MKKEKWQQLSHLIAGVIIIVFGFESFESGNFSSAAYYVTLAIIFLIVAGTHKSIVEKFRKADVAFNVAEAVTLIYSAFLYKSKGHHLLFYIIALVASVYIVVAIINLLSHNSSRHKSMGRKKRKRHAADTVIDQTNFHDINKT
jgi:hypothetical protein